MNSNDVLVIIDMQYFFKNRPIQESIHLDKNLHKKLIHRVNDTWTRVSSAVIKLIEVAKSKNAAIVVLEYVSDYFMPKGNVRRTVSSVRKALKDYSNVVFKKKNQDDGSYEIATCCDLSIGTFYITGFNLQACVRLTSESLAQIRTESNIVIVEEATGNETLPNNYKVLKKGINLRHDTLKNIGIV
jgi:hypothetical protein